MNRQQSSTLPIRNKKFVFGIAAILAILVTMASVAGMWQSVRAQGTDPASPFNQIFIVAQQIGPKGPAQPSFQENVTSRALEQLQNELPFTILQPAYLPSDTYLVATQRLDRQDEVGIELQYLTSNNRMFSLTETKSSLPMHLYIEQRKILQQLNINGQLGVLYDPGAIPNTTVEQRAILTWTDGGRWFELRGTVGFEELIKIAQSIPR